MESISSNANQSVSKIVRTPDRIAVHSKDELKSEEINPAKLKDFNGLAKIIDSSESTIRPEAVERGKNLISDPNWPNDTILKGLAEKLLEEEDFGS